MCSAVHFEQIQFQIDRYFLITTNVVEYKYTLNIAKEQLQDDTSFAGKTSPWDDWYGGGHGDFM